MNSANETIQGIREKLNSIKDAVKVIEFKLSQLESASPEHWLKGRANAAFDRSPAKSSPLGPTAQRRELSVRLKSPKTHGPEISNVRWRRSKERIAELRQHPKGDAERQQVGPEPKARPCCRFSVVIVDT